MNIFENLTNGATTLLKIEKKKELEKHARRSNFFERMARSQGKRQSSGFVLMGRKLDKQIYFAQRKSFIVRKSIEKNKPVSKLSAAFMQTN